MITSNWGKLLLIAALLSIPTITTGNSYICTLDVMGKTFESYVKEWLPAESHKSFGFKIDGHNVLFSEKGWFYDDTLELQTKVERDNKLVMFTAVNERNFVKVRDGKLYATTFLMDSIMSFVADCENIN